MCFQSFCKSWKWTAAAAAAAAAEAYLRLVVIKPATTQASKGSAVKLTAVKKIVEAANSTAAGFRLQHRSKADQLRLYNKCTLQHQKHPSCPAEKLAVMTWIAAKHVWCWFELACDARLSADQQPWFQIQVKTCSWWLHSKSGTNNHAHSHPPAFLRQMTDNAMILTNARQKVWRIPQTAI